MSPTCSNCLAAILLQEPAEPCSSSSRACGPGLGEGPSDTWPMGPGAARPAGSGPATANDVGVAAEKPCPAGQRAVARHRFPPPISAVHGYLAFSAGRTVLPWPSAPFFWHLPSKAVRPQEALQEPSGIARPATQTFTAAPLGCPDKPSTPASCRRGHGHRSSTTARCHDLARPRAAPAPE
jgi:hypothetical protein